MKMLKASIYHFLIFFLILSCTIITGSVNKDIEKEEDEIVRCVINNILGPDSVWQNRDKINPVLLNTPEETEDITNGSDDKKRVQIQDLNRKSELVVFVHDSLTTYSNDKMRIYTVVSQENFKHNFGNIDPDFRALILGMVDSTQTRYLNLESLTSQYQYKFEYESKAASYQNHNENIVGIILVSRAYLNEDLTKACIYSEFICEGECGGGSIYLFKKLNHQWTIVSIYQLWVG